MTIDRGKYVTFNRDNLNGLLGAFSGTNGSELREHMERLDDGLTIVEIQDAVVIRKKDTFAPTALYAYAAAVHSAIEILEGMQNGVVIDNAVIEHLNELADFFAGEADHARQLQGKIPD